MNAPFTLSTPADSRSASDARWNSVCRTALAKMLDELTYEEVLAPETEGPGEYALCLKSGITWRFAARTGAWGNLLTDSRTIRREPEGASSPLQFTLDARAELGMAPETLATFLRELSNTLRQDMILHQKAEGLDAERLLNQPVHVLHGLLEGHPKAVANKGRLGWGADDLARYSPESAEPFSLFWLAATRQNCRMGGEGDEAAFLRRQLGENETAKLLARLTEKGLSLETHTLIPVHPWQWDNVIQQAYVSDLAAGDLVFLGSFGGRYVAGPSLRTLTSIDRPGSADVKVALTILNTSAWRGIPGKYIAIGAALSDWLEGIVASDDLLTRHVTILREARGIWYRHPLYGQMEDAPYQHGETLGVIWRDNASGRVGPHRRACLYAALLHPDAEGRPLAVAHARRAGLDFEDWLKRLFEVSVVPLYHMLCRFGTGFIAHGQNITVVLEKDVPAGIAIKDLQGDVDLVNVVFPEQADLPDEVRSVLPSKPPAYIVHNIQTAHFVTVLRFFSARLEASGVLPEDRFYRLLADVLEAYMTAHQELAERHKMFDLFNPAMPRVCINKVRFAIGYGDAAQRPMPALGTDLNNPLRRRENVA
ncbi:MAG: IucA/IucC family protein [Pannonibacter phragmitetus]